MKIVDTLGGIIEVSLPKSGILPVGVNIQDVDTDTLRKELQEFYDDRLILEPDGAPNPVPSVVVAPTVKRSTKKIRNVLQNSDQSGSGAGGEHPTDAIASGTDSPTDP